MLKFNTYEEVVKEFSDSLISNNVIEEFSPRTNAYKILHPVMLAVTRLESMFSSFIDANSIFKAEGNDLDELLSDPSYDFKRRKNSKAKGFWETKNSVYGTYVEKGRIKFTDAKGITYVNTTSLAIDVNGYGQCEIECEEYGVTGNKEPGEINRIKTPISGIISGSNPTAVGGGAELETDYEYRTRWFKTSNNKSYWNTDGIVAQLLRVPGVTSARVLENDGDTDKTVDGTVMPSRSRRYYVLGGAPQDIAEAIFIKTDRAIKETGSEEVFVKDTQNEFRVVKFSRPKEVPIMYKIQVEGEVDTSLVSSLVAEYIKESEIAAKLSNYQFLKTYQSFIDDKELTNLEITFSRDNTNYLTNLQIEDFEKAKVGGVSGR